MTSPRPWTEFEIALLKELSDKQFNAGEAAPQIGRSRQSVYYKAKALGLRMACGTRRYPYPEGDPSTWDEAQRICAFANVPLPLARLVAEVSMRHGLNIKDVRSSNRLPKYVNCRFEIASVARRQGYALPVIGRAINRDHTTVLYAIQRQSA